MVYIFSLRSQNLIIQSATKYLWFVLFTNKKTINKIERSEIYHAVSHCDKLFLAKYNNSLINYTHYSAVMTSGITACPLFNLMSRRDISFHDCTSLKVIGYGWRFQKVYSVYSTLHKTLVILIVPGKGMVQNLWKQLGFLFLVGYRNINCKICDLEGETTKGYQDLFWT